MNTAEATASGSVMSRAAILGLSSGFFFVIATLIGVGLLNLPRAADAAVVGGSVAACPMAEVSLDQGYGVTQTALRPVCAGSDSQHLAGNSAAR